jgi:protein-tyrosine phosphatase
MIDLHAHLLVGIDDGSRSLERSRKVLQAMRGIGIEALVLTPHVRAGALEREPNRVLEHRSAAFDALRLEAPDGLRLELGFEVMLDQPLSVAAATDRRFTLAGSRYVLVEFPLDVIAGFATGVLRALAQHGVVPLVAHPERYHAVSPQAVRVWREAGARFQLDATSLTRHSLRGRRARRLLAQGLADVVAADNHGDRRTVATAYDYLTDRGHAAVAELLAQENPRAVIDDRELTPVPPTRVGVGLGARLRRIFRP